MTNYLLKSFAPQSTAIYGYLNGKKPMSAKDIGKALHILPHTVYRAVKPLVELGIIEEVNSYPIKFKAKPINDAIDLYSFTIRQNFQETFGSKNTIHKNKYLDISFIHSRQDLLERTNKDIKAATSNVNIVVSGFEVPGETVLGYKQALERGVTIRAIVQRLDETSKAMFKNWKRIGVQVKYYPNMEARIFIIDEEVIYFTSYNPNRKGEGIGMRFNYAPYAKLMSEMFEQRWTLAKEI